MLFGVWRGKRDDRGLGLRGRVVEWCSCVDKDDDEERRTDVAVYVDLGMVNAGEEMSWPSRSGGGGDAQGHPSKHIYATPFFRAWKIGRNGFSRLESQF